MKSERELHAEVQRGHEAERLLNHELIRGAIDDMRKAVYVNIESSHYKNIDEREDLYKMLQCIKKFENELDRHVKGAKKAKSLLKKLLEG